MVATNGNHAVDKKLNMKNRILIGLMLVSLCAGAARAADSERTYTSDDLYRANEFSVDFFGTGSIGESTINNLTGSRIRQDIRLGVGVGMNYFVTRNIGFAAEAYSENPNHSFVDDTFVSIVGRFPIG